MDRDSIAFIDSGKAFFTICTDSENKIIRFAAFELQRYLYKITGSLLPVIDTHDFSPLICFCLNKPEKTTIDSYTIEIAEQRIIFSGSNPRSILYAVYDFLEKLGCSWVYPGQREEIVPLLSTVTLKRSVCTHTAEIEHRGLALYGFDATSLELARDVIDWMAKNRFNLLLTSEDRPTDIGISLAHGCLWRQVADELEPEVQKRGIELDMSEHSTHLFLAPELYDKHPEWFALNDSKRVRGQICYSNAEAVEYYSSRQAEYARMHPEISILGTWPLDGDGYCECSQCKDTDTVFKMVIAVADKVKQVRPDLTVEHLAYKKESYPVPVSVEVPDNVSVLVCKKTDDLAKQWVKATEHSRGAYYFEYRMADNWQWAANIWIRPHYGAKVAKISKEVGFRGIISLFLPIQNWWRACLTYYIFAKSCWNTDIDVENELQVFYTRYFRENAAQASNIFDLIFSNLQNDALLMCHRAYNETDEPQISHAGFERMEKAWLELSQLLETAICNSANSIIKERFRRIRTYVEYFVLYYRARMQKTAQARVQLLEFSRKNPADMDGVCVEHRYLDYIFMSRAMLFHADGLQDSNVASKL